MRKDEEIMNLEIKPVKNLTEEEMKKLKKQGKVVRCPTRKAKGWKNIRWGQSE